jgi:ATP-dependent helicase YprA (DUF1998 family)
MRSIIATVMAFSSVSIGAVAVVQAHEIPEYRSIAYGLQDGRAVRSRDYFNQDVSRLYINRDQNCTAWANLSL